MWRLGDSQHRRYVLDFSPTRQDDGPVKLVASTMRVVASLLILLFPIVGCSSPNSVSLEVGVWQFQGATYENNDFIEFLEKYDCSWQGSNILLCAGTGVQFEAFDGVVRSVTATRPYRGSVPGEVDFGDTPDDVVAKLGEPDSTTATSMSWWVSDDTRLLIGFADSGERGLEVAKVSSQLM